MNRFDILLARDASNPEGLPGGWPVRVSEVEDDDPVRDPPWMRVTAKQLKNLRDPLRASAKARIRSIRQAQTKATELGIRAPNGIEYVLRVDNDGKLTTEPLV